MSKAKGDRREKQAKEILEEAGFRVEKKWNRRFDSNDYFNLFDLMAGDHDQFRFVQVKSNGTNGALKLIEQKATFLPWHSEHFHIEVWVCYDREGWRIQRLTNDGWEVVLDSRDSGMNMGEKVKSWLTSK